MDIETRCTNEALQPRAAHGPSGSFVTTERLALKVVVAPIVFLITTPPSHPLSTSVRFKTRTYGALSTAQHALHPPHSLHPPTRHPRGKYARCIYNQQHSRHTSHKLPCTEHVYTQEINTLSTLVMEPLHKLRIPQVRSRPTRAKITVHACAERDELHEQPGRVREVGETAATAR